MTRFVAPFAAAALAVSVSISAQTPAGRTAQPPLGPNQWLIDPDHSAANFSVRHLMVTTVRGQLGPITGSIEYDGKDVRTIKANVTIDVKGINTQNPASSISRSIRRSRSSRSASNRERAAHSR